MSTVTSSKIPHKNTLTFTVFRSKSFSSPNVAQHFILVYQPKPLSRQQHLSFLSFTLNHCVYVEANSNISLIVMFVSNQFGSIKQRHANRSADVIGQRFSNWTINRHQKKHVVDTPNIWASANKLFSTVARQTWKHLVGFTGSERE